jgi:cysteinyl-tRNA synthetase
MEEARNLRLDLVRFLERAAAAHAGPRAEASGQAAGEVADSALAERAWPRGSSWGHNEANLVAAHADAAATVRPPLLLRCAYLGCKHLLGSLGLQRSPASQKVRAALADDFDTPKAMRALAALAAAGEAYLLAKESEAAAASSSSPSSPSSNSGRFVMPVEPLALCAGLVANAAALFGVESVARAADHASAAKTDTSSSGGSALSGDAAEALSVLAEFRAEVRAAAKAVLVANVKAAKAAAKAAAAGAPPPTPPVPGSDARAEHGSGAASDQPSDSAAALAQALLGLCDRLRDDVLPARLGVALEDRPAGNGRVAALRK